jgi:copper homeostasis protein
MKEDVSVVRRLGADGVVFGILRPDGTIDKARTQALVKVARPMRVTFHRAFDMVRDPFASLSTLIETGVERVLTSGGEPTALDGINLIHALHIVSAGRIIVMPGGGVEKHLRRIVRTSGVKEVHVGPRSFVDSRMEYRNRRVRMGTPCAPPEYKIAGITAGVIRQIRTTLDRTG